MVAGAPMAHERVRPRSPYGEATLSWTGPGFWRQRGPSVIKEKRK